MNTIREVWGGMLTDFMIIRNGRVFFRIADVMAAAKEKGIENPEELLKKEAETGITKIVDNEFIEIDITKEVQAVNSNRG